LPSAAGRNRWPNSLPDGIIGRDTVHVDRYDEAILSKMSSRVRIMIFPTNEELMIARDTRDLIFGG